MVSKLAHGMRWLHSFASVTIFRFSQTEGCSDFENAHFVTAMSPRLHGQSEHLQRSLHLRRAIRKGNPGRWGNAMKRPEVLQKLLRMTPLISLVCFAPASCSASWHENKLFFAQVFLVKWVCAEVNRVNRLLNSQQKINAPCPLHLTWIATALWNLPVCSLRRSWGWELERGNRVASCVHCILNEAPVKEATPRDSWWLLKHKLSWKKTENKMWKSYNLLLLYHAWKHDGRHRMRHSPACAIWRT